MEQFKFRTRDNSNPQGKPRVYFTCHSEDFGKSFEMICNDIFKTQDCVIYYKEDITAEIPEEYQDVDLNRMNLFVIPVTFRLLTEANRAMDIDIAYALKKHIAILPIMLESGIYEFYAKRFGNLQYINPYSHDSTAIGYEEKLKKYLSSVLLDDDTAEKVRAAFDAYIFLSYRKKDRKYANELMRLIHSNPICRDIAIWYDEFLIPGENFSDSIEKMLQKSELFALLVTPNLITEDNYVKHIEYPKAHELNKNVLPAELVYTDKEELKRQYTDLPNVIDCHNDTALRESLIQAFSAYALRENDNDPVHNYLIGLAYLEGIDVEVNRERALELITMAAEAELPEAMVKLRDMYYRGYITELNWNKAIEWTKRITNYYTRRNGERDKTALEWTGNLATDYDKLGDYKKALELYDRVYMLMCEVLGEKHPNTLASLENWADIYDELGDHDKAAALRVKMQRK